jgi:hypothetical protein
VMENCSFIIYSLTVLMTSFTTSHKRPNTREKILNLKITKSEKVSQGAESSRSAGQYFPYGIGSGHSFHLSFHIINTDSASLH